jgi:hypothetical protein
MATSNYTETPEVLRHPIEVFQKYKNIKSNKLIPITLEQYISTDVEKKTNTLLYKLKSTNVFNNQEIKANLNFVINKKNMSGHDGELYDQIQNKLNKLTDKNFDEISEEIVKFPYTKSKHIFRLCEYILIKAIKETAAFSELYAKLCNKLLPCYIEVNSTKILFRTVLLTICQDMFNELIFDVKYDIQIKKKQEYDRLTSYDKLDLAGLTKFFGELNNKGIMPIQIISFCYDKLIRCVERIDVQNIDLKYEGINSIVLTCYQNIKSKDEKIYNDMKSKLEKLMVADKFPSKKCKFLVQDILDVM